MKNKVKKLSLSSSLLAGLLSGIISALLIVIFIYLYRKATGYDQINAIDPMLVFIGLPVIMIIAGSIYYLLVRNVVKGELIFIMLFSLITIVGILVVTNLKSSGNETLLTIPNGLLFGLFILTGLSICVFLPYLAHHPRLFLTSEQLKWEEK